MTLTDPRDALAEQSSFISYLVGLAGLAKVVRTLAEGRCHADPSRDADDLVHLLLGIASLGDGIERLAESDSQPRDPGGPERSFAENTRWLR